MFAGQCSAGVKHVAVVCVVIRTLTNITMVNRTLTNTTIMVDFIKMTLPFVFKLPFKPKNGWNSVLW